MVERSPAWWEKCSRLWMWENCSRLWMWENCDRTLKASLPMCTLAFMSFILKRF